MTKQVQISANEMKFLVKRSLEGMGFNPGEQLEAGKRLTSCFQLGLIGSHGLDQALNHLRPQIKAPVCTSKANHHWHFDAQGQTALIQAELAVGVALSHQAASVRISNTSEGVLLTPALMGWLSKPFANAQLQTSMAIYYETIAGDLADCSQAHTNQRCLLIDAQGQALYCPNEVQVTTGVVLVRFDRQAIYGQLLVNQAELRMRMDKALDHGLWLDAKVLERLKSLIIDSFVPESEASLAGAGPS